jgi:hypothetical protein
MTRTTRGDAADVVPLARNRHRADSFSFAGQQHRAGLLFGIARLISICSGRHCTFLSHRNPAIFSLSAIEKFDIRARTEASIAQRFNA